MSKSHPFKSGVVYTVDPQVLFIPINRWGKKAISPGDKFLLATNGKYSALYLEEVTFRMVEDNRHSYFSIDRKYWTRIVEATPVPKENVLSPKETG